MSRNRKIKPRHWGSRLTEIRLKYKVRQKDLAVDAGLDPSSFSRYEDQQFPPLSIIDCYCRACGIELWQFFVPADIVYINEPLQRELHTLYLGMPEDLRDMALQSMRMLARLKSRK